MGRSTFIISVLAALYCGIIPTRAYCEEVRLVTITIDNQTPSFQVTPSILIFGSSPKEFTTISSTKYQYKFPVSENDWFDPVDIKILWKNAFANNDGTTKDFEQRIVLRLRHDFPSDFSFPIYFSNNRSQNEMSRLEHEQDPNEQFEVYFRGDQIATYYRDTFGPQHPFTTRAAKIFFYSAVTLAETPQYFVAMSDDAERFIIDAYGSSSSYSARANQARAMYWSDLKQVDTYVARGDCATARKILSALQTLKSEDANAFNAQYGNEPDVLDEKARIINSSKCGAGSANQADGHG